MIQLGTRWGAGGEPPQRLTPEFVAALRKVESGVSDHASSMWTLTWLEGRPTATLESGTEPVVVVSTDATGSIVIDRDSGTGDDDSW